MAPQDTKNTGWQENLEHTYGLLQINPLKHSKIPWKAGLKEGKVWRIRKGLEKVVFQACQGHGNHELKMVFGLHKLDPPSIQLWMENVFMVALPLSDKLLSMTGYGRRKTRYLVLPTDELASLYSFTPRFTDTQLQSAIKHKVKSNENIIRAV